MQENICPNCYYCNEPDHFFCRNCGSGFDEGFDEPDQVLVLDFDQKLVARSIFTIGEVFVVLIIIVILLAISLPNVSRRGNRVMARTKACQANQRVLLGAIEMYNMDNRDAITMIDSDTMSLLVSRRYLRSELSLPESSCEYQSFGNLAEDGYISCKIHGSIESPIVPY